MKNLIFIVPIFIIVLFGCQNTDSNNVPPADDKVSTNPKDNNANELDNPNNFKVKLGSELPSNFSREKLYELSLLYRDNEDTLDINNKYYGSDYVKALTDYLVNLDLKEVKDGILYCYCDKASHPCEPECMDIIKKYCMKHDIDLFEEIPVSFFNPNNPNSNIWWVVKSSKHNTKKESSSDEKSSTKKYKFPVNFSRDQLCKITVRFDSNKNLLEINRETFEKDFEKSFENYLNTLNTETLKEGILFCYCDKAAEPHSTKYFSIVKDFCTAKDIDMFDEIPVSKMCKDSQHISWVVKSSKTNFKSE